MSPGDDSGCVLVGAAATTITLAEPAKTIIVIKFH